MLDDQEESHTKIVESGEVSSQMEFNFDIPVVSLVLKANKIIDKAAKDDIGMF
jgi:hypothetical protein